MENVIPNKKMYTILLFGESGAGKSTTINAVANYCKFDSFEAAEVGEFHSVIPSRFTLPDPKTFQPIRIENGISDDNERHNEIGASVTQEPKSYQFEFGDKTIRMIDTPGMGDTGGIEVDKKNFEKIVKYVTREIYSIHAICFLIKTITTRKTAVFQYCLNQILTHLRKNTYKNIFFCFTFSRNSFYSPSDGFETVRVFLDENPFMKTKIKLEAGVNCFFIDNEAYQYLLARKHNYPFTEDIRESYKQSWYKSVENITQMLNQIAKLSPIVTKEIFKREKQLPSTQTIPEPLSSYQSHNDEQTPLNYSIDYPCTSRFRRNPRYGTYPPIGDEEPLLTNRGSNRCLKCIIGEYVGKLLILIIVLSILCILFEAIHGFASGNF